MNCRWKVDKININLNKETDEQQIFSCKPSNMFTMKGKSNGLFHASKCHFSQP